MLIGYFLLAVYITQITRAWESVHQFENSKMQSRQLLLLVLTLASALAVAQAYQKHIWGTAGGIA